MKSIREVEKIASSREQKLTELSGREKRALAAERRLATQLPSDTAIVRYTHAHAHSQLYCTPPGAKPRGITTHTHHGTLIDPSSLAVTYNRPSVE